MAPNVPKKTANESRARGQIFEMSLNESKANWVLCIMMNVVMISFDSRGLYHRYANRRSSILSARLQIGLIRLEPDTCASLLYMGYHRTYP